MQLIHARRASNIQGAVLQQARNQNLLTEAFICSKIWPTSNQALSQPNRWALVLNAMWPSMLIKVVFYRAKISPTIVPTAVHTELIHFHLGKRCHCPFVFEWDKLSTWQRNHSIKWLLGRNKGNSEGRQSHWNLKWRMSTWGHLQICERKPSEVSYIPSFISQSTMISL